MQVSNRVGKMGATIYNDGADTNLMPRMRSTAQPEPAEGIVVDSPTAFTIHGRRPGHLQS